MCGFSGIISSDVLQSNIIEKSLKSIKHRGPDNTLITDANSIFSSNLSNLKTQNKFSDCKNVFSNVWFGFNRLSIVDFSENAMQPFYDEKTACFFMLNGEIYNYKEIKLTFLSDCEFISNSDSEVAFKLYLKLGDSFIEHLQGMFSIVVYHKNEKKLKIWRDRFGIKPFYYFHNSKQFIFSSEIKGILNTNFVDNKPNFQGIAYSMYLGTCPSPLTIYENIYSLQAGHKLEFSVDENKLEIEPYWILKYNPSIRKIEYPEFYKDVKNLCNLYYTGEAEKAIMLSGGIDSGTLAYFYALIDQKLKALTIFQNKSSNNELEFAENNARNAGLNLQNFEVSNIKEEENMYLSSEEEPNFIPEPSLFLCEKANQQNIRVLYNALGPDEIFGGYEYYAKILKYQKFEFLLNIVPSFLFPFKKRQKLNDIKKFGLQNFPFISRSVFSWKEITDFLETNKKSIPQHPIDYLNNQINNLYPDFKSLPLLKKVSYYDIFYYISSHHSLRADVPSMLHSIEMRFPFLEHTFVEKYFNQADVFGNLKFELKPRMREYAQNYLSHKVLQMPKKGFTIDIDKNISQKEWYKLGLKQKFEEILI